MANKKQDPKTKQGAQVKQPKTLLALVGDAHRRAHEGLVKGVRNVGKLRENKKTQRSENTYQVASAAAAAVALVVVGILLFWSGGACEAGENRSVATTPRFP